MLYFKFHIGDWASGTMGTTELERGIYLDLLLYSYAKERPIMRSECERIARTYTPEGKKAMEYVLERFFVKDGDCYRNQRVDKEIPHGKDKSEKARASANARWSKEKQALAQNSEPESTSNSQSERNADAMRTQSERNATEECERNAEAMLTNNQEPTNSNVADKPRHTSHTAKKVHLSEAFSALTEEWRQYAKQTRPDLDPDKVFARFRFYWTSGKGGNRLRTARGWTTGWQNWLKNEESDSDTATDEAPANPYAVKATPVDGELALPQESVPPMVDLNW